MVEFALIAPLFIMLVFGMNDFANTFNDYNSVRQGVREGARQAVVASLTDTGCTTGTSSARVACVTKARIGLDATRTKVKIDVPASYVPGVSYFGRNNYIEFTFGEPATVFRNYAREYDDATNRLARFRSLGKAVWPRQALIEEIQRLKKD